MSSVERKAGMKHSECSDWIVALGWKCTRNWRCDITAPNNDKSYNCYHRWDWRWIQGYKQFLDQADRICPPYPHLWSLPRVLGIMCLFSDGHSKSSLITHAEGVRCFERPTFCWILRNFNCSRRIFSTWDMYQCNMWPQIQRNWRRYRSGQD
jgi:hypothetical protein